jgi:3'(2'), 5'-bisphosphate nucleotidase
MNYAKELQVALHAAALAKQLILERYAHFRAIPNAPAQLTTETDRESQETILQSIRQAFPADALRAEEKTSTLEQAAGSGPRLWIVDPIDGTRGFARKNGEFSVMVAFVNAGQAVLGVVSEPARARLTYAVRGGGCWRQDNPKEAPERCRVTATAELRQMVVTQSHSRDPGRPSARITALGPARVIETYSAGIKLALVARGEADLYLNTYDACRDWDVCAGQVLVEEAGGRVTDLEGVVPRYSEHGGSLVRGLLASNGLLHPAALETLRQT